MWANKKNSLRSWQNSWQSAPKSLTIQETWRSITVHVTSTGSWVLIYRYLNCISWVLGAEYLSTVTYTACHEYWEPSTYLQLLILHVMSTGSSVLIYRYLSILHILYVMTTGSWVLIYRYLSCLSWVLGDVYLPTGTYTSCHEYWEMRTCLQVLKFYTDYTGDLEEYYSACHKYWEHCTYLQVFKYYIYTACHEYWELSTYLQVLILYVMSTGSCVPINRYLCCLSQVLETVYLPTGTYTACREYWEMSTCLQILNFTLSIRETWST